MEKAYSYRFYPTPEQESLLRRTLGTEIGTSGTLETSGMLFIISGAMLTTSVPVFIMEF